MIDKLLGHLMDKVFKYFSVFQVFCFVLKVKVLVKITKSLLKMNFLQKTLSQDNLKDHMMVEIYKHHS